jgi:hypothetical protein
MLRLTAHIIHGRSEQRQRSSKDMQKCGMQKPMKDFYINRGSKDGHDNRCAACTTGKTQEQIDEGKRLREQHALQRRARLALKTRACNDCGVVKPFTEFNAVRKRGPYGMYDYATGRCCQCQKDYAEFTKIHPATTVVGSTGLRFLVAEGYDRTPENAFARFRSKCSK